jgi:hypothetical protein
MDGVPGQVTEIVASVSAGDRQAAEELLPLVYEELRRLAAYKMAREKPGQTLQATALVHEAWLRMARQQQQHWESRAQFFIAVRRLRRRRSDVGDTFCARRGEKTPAPRPCTLRPFRGPDFRLLSCEVRPYFARPRAHMRHFQSNGPR